MVTSRDRSAFLELNRLAHRNAKGLKPLYKALLVRWTQQLAAHIREGASFHVAMQHLLNDWREELRTMEMAHGLAQATQGWLAGRAAHKPTRKTLGAYLAHGKALSVTDAGEAASPAIGFGEPELIARAIKPKVAKWIRKTSKIETATTARHFESIYREAIKGFTDPETGYWRNATPSDIADTILREGLTLSEERADLMANTLGNWAANEGAMLSYKEGGATMMEWSATEDDYMCAWCGEMDGTVVAIDDGFKAAGDTIETSDGAAMTVGLDVEHPPLHPNCYCVLLPVD